MRVFLRKPDGQSALLFVLLGVATSLGALQYPLGEPGRMGPGFFPFYLGLLLLGLGVLVGIKALWSGFSEMPLFEWRAALLIPISIAVGGLLLDWGGLAPSIVGMTFVSALATNARNWLVIGAIGIVLTVAAYLIFIVGIGLRIPLIRI